MAESQTDKLDRIMGHREPEAGSKAKALERLLTACRSIRHAGDDVNIGTARTLLRSKAFNDAERKWLTEWVDNTVAAAPEAPTPFVNPAALPDVDPAPLTAAQSAELRRLSGVAAWKLTDDDVRMLATFAAQTAGTPDAALVARVFDPVAATANKNHDRKVDGLADRYAGHTLHAELLKWAGDAMALDVANTDEFADLDARVRDAAIREHVAARLEAINDTAPDALDLSAIARRTDAPTGGALSEVSGHDHADGAGRIAAGRERARNRGAGGPVMGDPVGPEVSRDVFPTSGPLDRLATGRDRARTRPTSPAGA